MLKGSKLSIVFSNYAEGLAAQYVKLSLGLSHRYLRGKVIAILRPVEEMSHHLYGYGYLDQWQRCGL
jgi:hypothetical protein